jgi:hypothetical protein
MAPYDGGCIFVAVRGALDNVFVNRTRAVTGG